MVDARRAPASSAAHAYDVQGLHFYYGRSSHAGCQLGARRGDIEVEPVKFLASSARMDQERPHC